MVRELEHALVLAGGAITLIIGAITIFLGAAVGSFLPVIAQFIAGFFLVAMGIWGAIVGIVLIFSSRRLLKKKEAHRYGIIALVFSILGLITLQGAVIGPLLALIGSLLVVTGTK